MTKHEAASISSLMNWSIVKDWETSVTSVWGQVRACA